MLQSWSFYRLKQPTNNNNVIKIQVFLTVSNYLLEIGWDSDYFNYFQNSNLLQITFEIQLTVNDIEAWSSFFFVFCQLFSVLLNLILFVCCVVYVISRFFLFSLSPFLCLLSIICVTRVNTTYDLLVVCRSFSCFTFYFYLCWASFLFPTGTKDSH